ncbi:UMP-CMP kinase [Orchesella cincta]|uniref:UMP-CMP kinase n=1 Tax=Orchesella cincta TaxID=48709 RepID=A0A1D2M8K3_ORCCI|nr:UMP-CMP kinase [Orchesella cincta]
MMTTARKPNVIFILGQPGSGKGTQSSNVVQHFKFAHLSAGDLLRDEMKNETSDHRDIIKKNIDAGTIVPVEITCELLKRRMDEICAKGTWNFLIDGFPRNWNNVHGWETAMTDSVNLAFVLYLDAPEELCIERCLLRTDGSGRTDDNLDCLKKRIVTFTNDTIPIINYYMEKGVVKKVDASKSAEQVFNDIRTLLVDTLLEQRLEVFSP